jgi:predicted secreted protein
MANSDKNIRITTSKNKTTFPNIVFTGSSAGSSVITLEVLDDNTVSFTSNEGQVFSLDSNLSTGTIWSVNDVSGYPLLRADVGAASGATIRIAEGLGNVGIGETNPSFKLSLKGALGIGSTTTTNYTVFRFPSAGSGQTYILPSAYPGTGTSVLQSDTAGNLNWVPMVAGSPGGSGTVNSGTAGSVAFYAADGTALSGTGLIQVPTSGTAVSVFTNLDLRSQNDIRFFNSGNTFNTALQAGANSASYTLSLPTAPVFAGSGYSTILVDTSGNMFFAPLEGGLATTSVTGSRVVLRNRMEHHVWMSAGYTPLAAGPDNVIYLIPDSSDDGATKLTFQLKEFTIRVETPSAGSSRIQLERSSTDTGAFTLAATGSSLIGGFGLTVAGAGIYVTSTNTIAAGTFVTSGNLLRLNYTLLNATHANFSVQFTLNEV